MMSKQIQLPNSTRFGFTTLYQWRDSQGNPVNVHLFGTWEPPQFEPSDEDIFHPITQMDVGRLDLISQKYYGTPTYWWIIAYVNDIDDFLTMDVGKKIRIPALSVVERVLSNSELVKQPKLIDV